MSVYPFVCRLEQQNKLFPNKKTVVEVKLDKKKEKQEVKNYEKNGLNALRQSLHMRKQPSYTTVLYGTSAINPTILYIE